jgi:membrane protein
MNQTSEQKKQTRNQRRQRSPVSDYFDRLIRIVKGSFITFVLTKGTESAAALAFYTLFSLFPLLLTVVAVGSFFVDQSVVEHTLINLLPTMIPVSQDFIITNVQQVFTNRGAITILAFLGLIWSATSVFTVIIRNINSAWPEAAPRSYIRMRLWSMAIVAALAILLIISSFTITFKNLLVNFGLGQTIEEVGTFFSSALFVTVFPNIIRVVIFFGLYFWTPQIKVKKLAALIGAVVTAIIWQLISTLFSSYLGSGLARYEVIYGSLGKIVVLLSWIYFSAYIVLWGAHLTSSIDRHSKLRL